MCRVLEKTERGLGVREGWGGGAGVSSFLSTQRQGAVAGGPSPPPEAQCGDLGNQGDGSHGAAQGGFEGPVAWAHLPRTGVKSPGLSALLEANGLMEGRTMRAKESSRTCGDGDGGGSASFPRPPPREHARLGGADAEAQRPDRPGPGAPALLLTLILPLPFPPAPPPRPRTPFTLGATMRAGGRTHRYAGAGLGRLAGGLDDNGLEFLQLLQEGPEWKWTALAEPRRALVWPPVCL